MPSPELARLLRNVLTGLELGLSETQVEALATHFALLLRWNEKINLTSVRQPEGIAARHFAESLFLTKLIDVPGHGLLVDVGSGAGFPGLPLKVAWPSVEAILLEPNQKKATFLKEAIRSCGLSGIEVRAERLEESVAGELAGRAALATVRAVRPSVELVAGVKRLLAPGGRIALFLGEDAAAQVQTISGLRWAEPERIPHSERRVILMGQA